MLPLDPPPGTAPRCVLLTADAVGGVWTYALDLARGLSARGVRSVLVVLGPAPDAAQRAAATAVPGLVLHIPGAPLDWTAESPAALARAAAAVAKIARAEGAALIQLNSPALAAMARFEVPVVAVCHSCLATWWHAVHAMEPIPPDFAWRTALLAKGYARADSLAAPSAAFARATAETYGLARAPAVVHNGRSLPAAADPSAADFLSRDAAPFVVTAGRLWDEAKNLRALDGAAAHLKVPVLAAGSTRGPHGAAVMLSHARATGPMSAAAVARCLSRRPVFVSLARYEPFGLAVLEAAQAGCPLVLSDIPTFRELWGGAALFLPRDARDTDIAAAIDALLRDGERRAALRAAARERSHRYRVDAMAEGMLRIYGTVMSARRGMLGEGEKAA